jgi:hypothetical protein
MSAGVFHRPSAVGAAHEEAKSLAMVVDKGRPLAIAAPLGRVPLTVPISSAFGAGNNYADAVALA